MMRSGLNEALPALPEPGTELLRVPLGARLRCFLIERLLRKRLRAVEAQGLPLLACFPLDSIGREIVSDGFYERELLAALFDGLLAAHAQRFSAMAAIDVGANIGNHSCFFAPRFRQVVSFEVNPTAAKLLEANAMFNGYGNVSVRNVGLGDEPASLVFEEFKRGNLGRSRFVDAAPAGLGARRLPVERYDDLEEGLGLEAPVALVKVDVEGFEFRVLRGMRRMLERDRPFVMFESHTAGGEHGGRALFELLRTMGYRR
ncbi:MAG TPA: FkbM family methyltransferase, partial [Quisquiliibacterium sp.]|nr:FkbM family methyltransferase [Quisquiliibacterium sp.]